MEQPRIKTISKAALGLTLLLLASGVFGQESYRVDESGKITQALSWTRTNAYFFEIEIEQQLDGVWTAVTRERTEDITIEVSLAPGMYRYRVHSYNVLGRVSASSDWTGFRIYPATAPVVESFTPQAFYVDGARGECIITLTGRDLSPEAVVVLVKKEKGPGKTVESLAVQGASDERSLLLSFSAADLEIGAYDLVITNPGGLSSAVEGFSVRFKKKSDLNLSAGYAPLLPLGGTLFTDGYTKNFYPLGFYGRVSVIPFKRLWGSLGVELSPQWADLKTGVQDGTLKGQLALVNLNAVYEKWFYDYTLAFNIRVGAGGLLYTMKFPYSDTETSLNVSLDAGVSAKWYLWRELFIEAGLIYVRFFSGTGSSSGFASFSLGGGWRL
ncbi:MAG: hypothetical protein LBK64_07540 [Spirochaetaceae bacterium]|nr:hypothetical protein [Spirochaetaceae bacterium]